MFFSKNLHEKMQNIIANKKEFMFTTKNSFNPNYVISKIFKLDKYCFVKRYEVCKCHGDIYERLMIFVPSYFDFLGLKIFRIYDKNNTTYINLLFKNKSLFNIHKVSTDEIASTYKFQKYTYYKNSASFYTIGVGDILYCVKTLKRINHRDIYYQTYSDARMYFDTIYISDITRSERYGVD